MNAKPEAVYAGARPDAAHADDDAANSLSVSKLEAAHAEDAKVAGEEARPPAFSELLRTQSSYISASHMKMQSSTHTHKTQSSLMKVQSPQPLQIQSPKANDQS